MMPLPRVLPRASSSSMKMMQGAFCSACWNMSRTRAAPTPTNISTKSEPVRLKNGTPASPAIALASSVLPVPGGPTSSTPLGIRPPSTWYFSGVLRNSTTSRSSSTASSMPATSSNVMSMSSWAIELAAAAAEGHRRAGPAHPPHHEDEQHHQQAGHQQHRNPLHRAGWAGRRCRSPRSCCPAAARRTSSWSLLQIDAQRDVRLRALAGRRRSHLVRRRFRHATA